MFNALRSFCESTARHFQPDFGSFSAVIQVIDCTCIDDLPEDVIDDAMAVLDDMAANGREYCDAPAKVTEQAEQLIEMIEA